MKLNDRDTPCFILKEAESPSRNLLSSHVPFQDHLFKHHRGWIRVRDQRERGKAGDLETFYVSTTEFTVICVICIGYTCELTSMNEVPFIELIFSWVDM